MDCDVDLWICGLGQIVHEAHTALEVLTSPHWSVSKVIVWLAIVLVVAYVVSPIDLIPDHRSSLLGFVDDLFLLVWLVFLIRAFMRYG